MPSEENLDKLSKAVSRLMKIEKFVENFFTFCIGIITGLSIAGFINISDWIFGCIVFYLLNRFSEVIIRNVRLDLIINIINSEECDYSEENHRSSKNQTEK